MLFHFFDRLPLTKTGVRPRFSSGPPESPRVVAGGRKRRLREQAERVARKLPRLQRVLDAPALFSIAYGEIASSIYFALGIIAFHALGFTPAVLLLTGALFLLV